MSKGIYGGRLRMRSGLWMSDLLFEIPDSPSLRKENLALLNSIKDNPDLCRQTYKVPDQKKDSVHISVFFHYK